ncbi:hypothetical protein ACP4OV_014788 [Aristida adscensionis]
MAAAAAPSGERHPPLWSDLPAELAGLILYRLPPRHADHLSFRAVCRQWRLAARRRRALPWLRLGGARAFRCLPGGELRSFTGWPAGECECDAAGACSSDGWLLLERRRSPGRRACFFFLADPFSGATIELPPRLPGVAGDDDDAAMIPVVSLADKMAVRSPDRLVAASLHGMAIGFFTPGAATWSVSPPPPPSPPPDGHRRGSYYDDIAFHRGNLYALTADEDLFAHHLAPNGDAGAGTPPHVEHAIKAAPPPTNNLGQLPSRTTRYLLAGAATPRGGGGGEDGRLLMVRLSTGEARPGHARLSSRWLKVKVFAAELDAGRWREVGRLEDGEALFVSRGCSRALRMASDGDVGGDDDERFQGNRVYFLGIDMAGCGEENDS